MKRTVILVVLLILSVKLSAQQEYFIFIHTEDQQPFYSRIGDKTFSSSSIGHLIIPNLKDSLYKIIIGFPKNQFPEQSFSIKINRKDGGYSLKNTREGWALFNLQSLQLIKAEQVELKKNSTSYGDVKMTDAYTVLMAGVVNDSAILYASTAKAEIPIEEIKSSGADTQTHSSEIVKKSATPSPSTENTLPGSDSIKGQEKDTIAIEKPAEKKEQSKPAIVQISSQRVNGGVQLVYMDKSEELAIDTVILVIPTEVEDIITVQKETKLNSDTLRDIDNAANTSRKIEDKTVPQQKDTIEIIPPKNQITMVNSDCINLANETDVRKLRLKFRANHTDDDRINIARKVFRTKCFSTSQVVDLIEFFPTDEGKYKLFDAVYPFVSDTYNFRLLKQLLHEEYYINRFKAMVRE